MNSHLTLPPELSIYTVAALLPSLLHALSPAADASSEAGANPVVTTLSLDAAPVTQVDSAGLQLLQALALQCQKQAQSLQLLNPSAQLCAAAQALGLQSLMQERAA